MAVSWLDSLPLPLPFTARTSKVKTIGGVAVAGSPVTVKDVAFAPLAALLSIVVQLPR